MEDIIGKIGLAVRLMALVTLLTGLAVLVSALSAARRQQLRQSVLFKVVGAERLQIGRIFLAQYAMIGAVAAVLGAVLGVAASFAVVHFALDMRWSLAPLLAAVVPVAAVLATLVIGALGLRRVLGVPARRSCAHPRMLRDDRAGALPWKSTGGGGGADESSVIIERCE